MSIPACFNLDRVPGVKLLAGNQTVRLNIFFGGCQFLFLVCFFGGGWGEGLVLGGEGGGGGKGVPSGTLLELLISSPPMIYYSSHSPFYYSHSIIPSF